MNPTKTCSRCHETKSLNEFYKDNRAKDGKQSECKKCHDERTKKYCQEHPEEMTKYKKEWYENIGRERCGCYSMYENKTCLQYLGIVIAEHLCRYLFKDVQVMPYGNPKFDFICNRGKKIDVKSACISLQYNKYPRWAFTIDYNKIADYFILIAFDNRTDLNPLYLWMIPGNELNHRASAQIRPSIIHKWDKWKRDIEDAQLCCN